MFTQTYVIPFFPFQYHTLLLRTTEWNVTSPLCSRNGLFQLTSVGPNLLHRTHAPWVVSERADIKTTKDVPLVPE